MPFVGCLDGPKAPVRIPVECPPQDPLPVPINMVYCYRSGFPFSRRAAEGELSLRRDGARDSLSWMLDARLSNSCVLNFRGTPPVESRVGIPLFVCPQPMLLAICLKLVYSYNSSENEEKLQCCTTVGTCVGVRICSQCNNLSIRHDSP